MRIRLSSIAETKPVITTPPETMPTKTPVNKLEETEPQIDKDSYEFKRQVAQNAAQYLNQYRSADGIKLMLPVG